MESRLISVSCSGSLTHQVGSPAGAWFDIYHTIHGILLQISNNKSFGNAPTLIQKSCLFHHEDLLRVE